MSHRLLVPRRCAASLAVVALSAFATSALARPLAKPAKGPPTPAAPAAVPATADAGARTLAMVAAFQRVPARGSVASRTALDKGFVDVDGFLDFATLTQEPIRPHLAKFDTAQRAAFASQFREVIRLVAYPDSGDFFRKAAIKVGAPRAGAGGTWVDISARSPEDGSDTRIGLLWRLVGGTLRVADLTFDGDSLVKDYQNQFGRILSKEGATGLLKRLEDKRTELAPKDK